MGAVLLRRVGTKYTSVRDGYHVLTLQALICCLLQTRKTLSLESLAMESQNGMQEMPTHGRFTAQTTRVVNAGSENPLPPHAVLNYQHDGTRFSAHHSTDDILVLSFPDCPLVIWDIFYRLWVVASTYVSRRRCPKLSALPRLATRRSWPPTRRLIRQRPDYFS